MFIRYFTTTLILLSLCSVSANIIPKGIVVPLRQGYGQYSTGKGFSGPIAPRILNYYNFGQFGNGAAIGGKGFNPGKQGGMSRQSGIPPIIGKGPTFGVGKGPIVQPIIGKGMPGPIFQGGIPPIIGKGMTGPSFQGSIPPIIGKGTPGPIFQGSMPPIIRKGMPGPIFQGGRPF